MISPPVLSANRVWKIDRTKWYGAVGETKRSGFSSSSSSRWAKSISNTPWCVCRQDHHSHPQLSYDSTSLPLKLPTCKLVEGVQVCGFFESVVRKLVNGSAGWTASRSDDGLIFPFSRYIVTFSFPTWLIPRTLGPFNVFICSTAGLVCMVCTVC